MAHPEYIRPDLAESVTPAERVALVRVMEEASELVKECAKALRFGLGNRYPNDGPTNAEKMASEYADLRGALYSLGIPALGVVTLAEIEQALGAGADVFLDSGARVVRKRPGHFVPEGTTK